MISAASVKTFFKKNAIPIVLAVAGLTVVMLMIWLSRRSEDFAAPLPDIVTQIRTKYANEHARFKAALMLLKPQTADQQAFVALAKTAMNAPLKIAMYDPKDDRAQGPTVVAGAITYPWINSKGTAVVAKDDIEDNVAWAMAYFAGSTAGDLKVSPKRLAAYQYLTAQIPRASATNKPAGKPADNRRVAFINAKKLIRPGDIVLGAVTGKQAPAAGGKKYSYTIQFTPKGKLMTSFVFQTPNANLPATVKIAMDRDGDVIMVNGAPYDKWNPLG